MQISKGPNWWQTIALITLAMAAGLLRKLIDPGDENPLFYLALAPVLCLGLRWLSPRRQAAKREGEDNF
ncbi:MAG: hypothetical protein LBH86_01605 [Oscillospiraceae bacterium]|jgi:hypothetical protein|nr:hypothetical protein [Oscillospiraceae bacterium]